MMALSGVRSSCETLARNSDLMRLASSAFSFSTAYFSASSTSCCACFSSCWRERRRSATVVGQRALVLEKLRLVLLQRRDVGADRDEAAVVGAPLVDLQPAAVLDARLDRARAGAVVGRRKAVGDDRAGGRSARSRHRACPAAPARREGRRAAGTCCCRGRAGCRRPTARRLPRSPRWRRGGGCRRCARPRPAAAARSRRRRCRRDAARPRRPATTSARARIQIQCPSAWRMRNSRSIWPSPARIRPLASSTRSASSGCDQLGDLADREQAVLRLEPENLEHRLRPEDRAARQVPFPQAGTAAPERRVEAGLRLRIDEVGLVRARRLRVIGKAEDDEHDARRHEDGRLARDRLPPFGEDAGGRLQHGDRRRRRRDCDGRWRSPPRRRRA